MSEETCSCCGGFGEQDGDSTSDSVAAPDGDVDRWITGPGAIDEPIPEDVQTTMGQFLGVERTKTIREWVEEFQRRLGQASLGTDDLCHASGETPHWGKMDGERYYFECFYDALLLSELAEEAVDVRTESPAGTVIEARVDGVSELTTTPEGAVVSFGVGRDAAAASDGAPTLGESYAAICPYVKAFPNRAEYEQWEETVDAATVAMPLADATEAAGTMVGTAAETA